MGQKLEKRFGWPLSGQCHDFALTTLLSTCDILFPARKPASRKEVGTLTSTGSSPVTRTRHHLNLERDKSLHRDHFARHLAGTDRIRKEANNV
jgi:hypothetical protein